jgi:hypothetical protein
MHQRTYSFGEQQVRFLKEKYLPASRDQLQKAKRPQKLDLNCIFKLYL